MNRESSKKLSRAVGMLYKIRDYSQKHVLKTLYHSIFSSHLSYGLPVLGNADRVFLDCIIKLQKKAIRAISFSSYTAHSKPIFKDFEILTLNDLTYHKMASLMWMLTRIPYPLFYHLCLLKKIRFITTIQDKPQLANTTPKAQTQSDMVQNLFKT